MKTQNVFVIGEGGREHALAWKLAQSKSLGKLFVSRGNPGTETCATNLNIEVNDTKSLINFAKKNQIDLTVIGPDNPLANGIVDKFEKAGLKVFGPSKQSAKIEWSKAFAKRFMTEVGIPTASFKVFSDYKKAKSFLKKANYPLVIKFSGLAKGKGVFVCKTQNETEKVLAKIFLDKEFGDSGIKVVVEEFLEGDEISVHTLCSKNGFKTFPASQDHKRLLDNDLGPNTGGMGSFAPVPWVNTELMKKITKQIVEPTIQSLQKKDLNFQGCLFPGVIVTPNRPKVLEYNARFGDPETQTYMRLLKNDLLELLNACLDNKLDKVRLRWEKGYAVCVVLTTQGYPTKPVFGDSIKGLEEAEKMDGVVVFHSGTTKKGNRLLTAGGRVLSVTAVGKTLKEAQEKVYSAVNKIKFKGMHFRTDIAEKSLIK